MQSRTDLLAPSVSRQKGNAVGSLPTTPTGDGGCAAGAAARESRLLSVQKALTFVKDSVRYSPELYSCGAGDLLGSPAATRHGFWSTVPVAVCVPADEHL